jgi:hypothetical protein
MLVPTVRNVFFLWFGKPPYISCTEPLWSCLKCTKLGLSQENRDKCKPEISPKWFGYQTVNEIRINRRNIEVYARDNRKTTNRSEWAMHTTACASKSPFIRYCETRRNKRVGFMRQREGSYTRIYAVFRLVCKTAKKPTISFILSICLSVLTVRVEPGSYWTDCHAIW